MKPYEGSRWFRGRSGGPAGGIKLLWQSRQHRTEHMSKWFKLPLSVIRRDGLILKEGQPMQSSANVTLCFLIFRSIFPQTLHLSVSWITQGPRTKSSPVWPRGSSCDKSSASASGVWKCCWGSNSAGRKDLDNKKIQKEIKRTHVAFKWILWI